MTIDWIVFGILLYLVIMQVLVAVSMLLFFARVEKRLEQLVSNTADISYNTRGKTFQVNGVTHTQGVVDYGAISRSRS